jgi:predicted dithiol-disulfide oxidoreductase (DUF899 family)
MNLPRLASQDEWLTARKDLLKEEKEVTLRREALNARRRELPMVKLDKEYVFEGIGGKASLLDAFEGRHQLIIYHFMFGPDDNEGHNSCSLLVDNISHEEHLHALQTTIALVSRAPLSKLLAFKARMGWTIPWYSSFGSDFNYDFHVTIDESIAPVQYNYKVNRSGFDAGFIVEASPAGTSGCERNRRLRILRAERSRAGCAVGGC